MDNVKDKLSLKETQKIQQLISNIEEQQAKYKEYQKKVKLMMSKNKYLKNKSKCKNNTDSMVINIFNKLNPFLIKIMVKLILYYMESRNNNKETDYIKIYLDSIDKYTK